ncbi:sigma-70 family RNA polymerase sigma factor [Thermosynechococcaceae cyanobacterium BACA0444]|uniref:Sigma-70 family RNA polymerase sigma factor n=1 Tax=Pseudocalidococcus azoricus BACA0444 TaxID=2918990 RepID=A0AAE4K0G0_9CYAN|nr:sigma-70 family RNA polymerase sigma factor [Pseudocalidococcus azoricus]MDS3861927.1 sigma-70 family RNA polymerase sigma factor [Pseudocalidococcus azoricus BACA0444]
MILKDLSDAELITRARQGQHQAMGILYDRYGSFVYHLALRILNNVEEAEDMTQDIFSQLINKAYNQDRGSLRAFLTVLTRSRSIDRLRKLNAQNKNIQYIFETKPVYTSAQEVANTDERQRVRQALDQLPATHRQVLELAYYSGLSQSEIAANLDTPLGTIKSRARNGLIQLKRLLADLRE